VQRGAAEIGPSFGVHANAKAIGRSKGDEVVLMASENITCRILFRIAAAERRSSVPD